MHTLPEALGTSPEAARDPAASELPIAVDVASSRGSPDRRLAAAWSRLRWPLAVYVGTRIVYLLIAFADHLAHHRWSVGDQLSNWDGVWYMQLVAHGYPSHVSHAQTTLGFFPLYPLVVWIIAHALVVSYVIAGVLVSLIGGFVATVLIARLCADWWGEEVARRSLLLFCLFPGSIVFSMTYTEGLMLSTAAGCLLALQHRRWWLAGGLAALTTATGPVGLAIVPACAVAAGAELWPRRSGGGLRWPSRRALRSLAAPLLAPLGLVLFGAYLWAHTGSPLASYTAQRYGWDERSSPLALYDTAHHLFYEVVHFHGLHHHGINMNYVAGLVGAIVLVVALVWLLQGRRTISLPALVWTLAIAVLVVTSENTPPNARMLLVAFPVVVVFAQRLRARAFAWLLGVTTTLLLVMSFVSLVGTALRP
ncbi:MAG: mannosyltransferase family protein [Solirubrobacteraceae bacterium]